MLFCSTAQAQKRIALVVTNQAYTQAGARLANTHRDGDLVKAALETVGFTVWVVKDTADERTLMQSVAQHLRRLAEAGPDAIGFFYYSGHGAADRPNGENFLIPTNAPLTHASQLPLLAVPLDKITAALASAGRMSFVVFDACRNVPLLRETKDLAFKGFAPVREQNGLLVAFATEPGNVAVDQSLYARVLAEEMVKPGAEAGAVFRRVRLRVREETRRTQSPEYLDKRDHDFHFASAAPAAVATPAPVAVPPKPSQPVVAVSPSPQPARCDGVLSQIGSERRCLKPNDSFKDCPDCPEMVVIPAGEFTMGSPSNEEGRRSDEDPQRKVTIARPFAAGKFELTFVEWDACVAASGCKHEPGASGRGKRPVINVSWDDAKEYIAWLSKKTGRTYRLLTEAEWEYAARAGTTTPFSTGRTITTDQANFNGDYTYGGSAKGVNRGKTIEVGLLNKPNDFGLHDMHGNVWEWVQDCYEDSYSGASTDGSAKSSASCSSRVFRGGSWSVWPRFLRSADRGLNTPGFRFFILGFRVARTLD
jgi:formylglycine-generating enzyme required for sulfatase activity